MNWNSGAGAPSTFQCSSCRSLNGLGWPNGSASRVTLTGRTRPYRGKGHAMTSKTAREYECGDCGHVGWSNHRHLEAKAGESA